MAKRFKEEEGEKKKLDKEGIRKLLGIFRFVLPYRNTFALGLVALGLSSGIILSFPYLAGKLLDDRVL